MVHLSFEWFFQTCVQLHVYLPGNVANDINIRCSTTTSIFFVVPPVGPNVWPFQGPRSGEKCENAADASTDPCESLPIPISHSNGHGHWFWEPQNVGFVLYVQDESFRVSVCLRYAEV